MTTVTRPSLLSAMAYMLQAAGVTVAELAQHMGHKLEAAPIVLPPRPAPDADKLLPRELEVLQRIDNPDGASIPELMAIFGISIQTASGYVARLERLGKIVRTKAPGVRAPRCFVDPVAAQRWHDSHADRAAADLQRARKELEDKHQAERQRIAAKEAERQRKAEEKAQRKVEKAAAREAAKPAPKPRPAPQAPQGGTIIPKQEGPLVRGQAVETAATRRIVDSTKRPNARWQAAQLEPDPRFPSFADEWRRLRGEAA